MEEWRNVLNVPTTSRLMHLTHFYEVLIFGAGLCIHAGVGVGLKEEEAD